MERERWEVGRGDEGSLRSFSTRFAWMSIPSFAGAPLTKGTLPTFDSPSPTAPTPPPDPPSLADLFSPYTALIVSITFVSVLAAITSTQQYLNIPLVPHLTRDKQFFRLLTSHLAFTNSSEVFLAVLILWYSGPGVERIWGTKKLAVRCFSSFSFSF